jgi:predicted DNA-binding transcriptional regulator YafY
VLELLQNRSAVSGPELAARLEVDVRTVRRYIAMLQDLGIPVENRPGRNGGYVLTPGKKIPPLIFTPDEVLALGLGLSLVRRLGIKSTGDAVEIVSAKIERVLSPALRQRLQALQTGLVLDVPTANERVESGTLDTLLAAAGQNRQVLLIYKSSDTMSQSPARLVDAYGIVFHTGRWYLVGFCHARGAIRVFRVDRVQQVTLQSTNFERPPDFDSLGYLIDSFAAIEDRWDVTVLLQADFATLQPKVPPGFARLEQLAEGVLLRAWTDDLDWTARFLVGLGCPFQIVQPDALREAIKRLAHELLRVADVPQT